MKTLRNIIILTYLLLGVAALCHCQNIDVKDTRKHHLQVGDSTCTDSYNKNDPNGLETALKYLAKTGETKAKIKVIGHYEIDLKDYVLVHKDSLQIAPKITDTIRIRDVELIPINPYMGTPLDSLELARQNEESNHLPTETILEAEDDFVNTTLNGATSWQVKEQNDTGFITVNSGDACGTWSEVCGARIDYVFDIPSTGDYYVHVRFYAENAGKDSFHFGWNGVYEATYNGLSTSSWQWMTTAAVNLSSGVHTLNIWNRELGLKIDQIKVSTKVIKLSD